MLYRRYYYYIRFSVRCSLVPYYTIRYPTVYDFASTDLHISVGCGVAQGTIYFRDGDVAIFAYCVRTEEGA